MHLHGLERTHMNEPLATWKSLGRVGVGRNDLVPAGANADVVNCCQDRFDIGIAQRVVGRSPRSHSGGVRYSPVG